MNNPQIWSLIGLGSTACAVLCCLIFSVLYFKTRAHVKNYMALALEMEGKLMEVSGELQTATQRTAEQSRRIAWLESRVRTGAGGIASPGSVESISGDTPATSSKPSITERRHRVLSLAQRGHTTESIAATLGVPRGEVELIIGLSRAA